MGKENNGKKGEWFVLWLVVLDLVMILKSCLIIVFILKDFINLIFLFLFVLFEILKKLGDLNLLCILRNIINVNVYGIFYLKKLKIVNL